MYLQMLKFYSFYKYLHTDIKKIKMCGYELKQSNTNELFYKNIFFLDNKTNFCNKNNCSVYTNFNKLKYMYIYHLNLKKSKFLKNFFIFLKKKKFYFIYW